MANDNAQQQQQQLEQQQLEQQQREHIPLASYRFLQPQQQQKQHYNGNGGDINALGVRAHRVYVIKCQPQAVPLDVNIQWLLQQGWNPDLDRLRYSPDQLYMRRFCPTAGQDYCVLVQLQQSMNMTVYGNDAELVERYFEHLFLRDSPMDVQPLEMQVLSRGWSESPHDLAYFCGSIHSAFGIWGRLLVDMQLSMATLGASSASIGGGPFH